MEHCLRFYNVKAGLHKRKIDLEIIREPAIMQVLQVILSILMFTVPFIVIFKAGGMRISDLVPIKKPEKGMNQAFNVFHRRCFLRLCKYDDLCGKQIFQLLRYRIQC